MSDSDAITPAHGELQPTPGRDARVDFWRGLCLVGMVSWHILSDFPPVECPSYPKWLSFPVIQGFNFVAEGFVLLAGVAVGIVVARRPGKPLRAGRFLRRAVNLLLVHYAVAVVLLLLFHAPNAAGPTPQGSWWQASRAILTLAYQPYLGDILSVFVLLFAATPVFLAVQKAFGSRVLFGLSLAVYLAANLLPASAAANWQAALELNHHGAFDFNSWQFVFVCGMLLGQHHRELIGRVQRSFWPLLAIGCLGFLVAGGYRFTVELGVSWTEGLPGFLRFDRHPLTPPRAVYIALQMFLIALLTIRLWDRLAGLWVVRAIVLFGRNSLVVFVWSILLDYALKAAVGALGWGFPLNLSAWAAALVVLYLVARGSSQFGR